MSDTDQIYSIYGDGLSHNISVSFLDGLDSGELLTGTPTVQQVSPGSPEELTLANKAVNTSTLTINGVSNVAGQAVQFSVACSTAGVYEIFIRCGTDATPAGYPSGVIQLIVNSSPI